MGNSAFAHKGGMHIDGVSKATSSLSISTPAWLGIKEDFSCPRWPAGKRLWRKSRRSIPPLDKDSPEAEQIIQRIKEMEHQGYQFEGAESTFELIVRKQLGKYKPFFELEKFKLVTEQPKLAGPLGLCPDQGDCGR